MGDEPLTILYIDDSEVQLQSVAEVLRAEGHKVHTALNVEAALRKVNEADLVMIDYHMPEMQGGDLLRVLQPLTSRNERHVVYYLYTSDHNVAVTYRDLGFDGAFISKGEPALLPDQLATAARVLRLRRFRRRKKDAVETKLTANDDDTKRRRWA